MSPAHTHITLRVFTFLLPVQCWLACALCALLKVKVQAWSGNYCTHSHFLSQLQKQQTSRRRRLRVKPNWAESGVKEKIKRKKKTQKMEKTAGDMAI